MNAIISGLSGSIPKDLWEGVTHTEEEAAARSQQYDDRQDFLRRANGGN